MYHQQNNSPSRSYNANINLNAPQVQYSGQAPSLNIQGPSTQYSGLGQHNTHVNVSGQGQFSGQGPSVSLSGPNTYSREGQFSSSTQQTSFNTQGPNISLSGPESRDYSRQGQFTTHQTSFNTQGPSVSLSGPGSRQYTSHQTSFNTQGPSINVSGGHQNEFNSNNQFSAQGNLGNGPEFNASLGGQGQYGVQGNFNMQGGFDEPLPTSSEGIKKYILKMPYTQNIDGQEITYSIIPKKQQSFVMTHERFLLLKGIEILGYAREFNQQSQLPFYALQNIPSPKTVVQLANIERVDVTGENLIVKHNDQKKTVWEFVCPTKKCAVQWKQKIDEAIRLFFEYQNSGFATPAEFYQFRSGNLGNRSSPPQPPPIDHSPPRFNAEINTSPSRFNANINTSPPRIEANTNINYRVNHDDEVSRSIYDNSGPKVNQTRFGQVNYNVSSPVKTQSYEVNYQVNQQPPQGLNVNANYQGSHGSTYNSSSTGGRSFTVSSNSSLGRYPLGMPMGTQPQVMQGRSNYRNV